MEEVISQTSLTALAVSGAMSKEGNTALSKQLRTMEQAIKNG